MKETEITLDEARQSIGDTVVYKSHPRAEPEIGRIVEVGPVYVWVQYEKSSSATATPAELITLES